MAIKISFKPKDATKKLLGTLSERAKDVLIRRYGLGKSIKRETLESVGRSYGITRERVRQIENAAIISAQASEQYKKTDLVFTEMGGIIRDLGSVVSEDIFLEEVSSNEGMQNHIHFLLVLGSSFTQLKESQHYVRRWYEDEKLANKVHTAVDAVHGSMTKSDLLPEAEVITMILDELKEMDDHHKQEHIVKQWLGLSKRLAKNPLGDWGHAGSPGVSMRGIRDMAWLVLRKNGSPMHYKEVAKAIIATFKRKAHSATCHNELIKDDRFILVGRGLYALSQWGYSTGLVKDVIKDILVKNGPLKKNKLVEMVKRERYVKTNTIIVNLQDTDIFTLGADDKYSLTEA